MMLLSDSCSVLRPANNRANMIKGKDNGPTAQNSGTGQISDPRRTSGSVSDVSQTTSEELEPEPDVVVLTTRGSAPERLRLLISGGN